MRVAEHIAALRTAGARMVDVVASLDLEAPVPSCPGWVGRDLVRHMGGIHRWATRYVTEARTAAIDQDLDELVGGWPPDEALVRWLDTGCDRLVAALTDAPADLTCFTFLDAPSPLAMWARRQAHETSIHRVDAELVGGKSTGFPLDLAIDGIDELLTAFITRPGRGPRAAVPTSLVVAPTDDPARWTVRFDADRCRTERVVLPADATVSGSAPDLYAWVWNRPGVGEIAMEGERRIFDTWRETVHVRWS